MFLLMNLGNKVRTHREYLRARLARDEEGVTAMEYGLIAALIAIVIILALTFAGTALQNIFFEIACALQQGEYTASDEPTMDDCVS